MTKSKEFPENTDVRLVSYEVGRYSLRESKDLIEEAHKTSWYVKDVFNNHEPAMGIEPIVPFGNAVHDPAIDRVIDDISGLYARSKQFSTDDRLKIVLLITVITLTVTLFAIGQPIYAVLTIAIEVLIAVLGIPNIIRRQRE